MSSNESLLSTLKRVRRITNYAGLLQFGGKAVIGKSIALLKVPALGAALFSLGFVYKAYLSEYRFASVDPLYEELEEVLAENAEAVAGLDVGTLISSIGFVGLCLFGVLVYLRGRTEHRKEIRAVHNGMDLLCHLKSRYIPMLAQRMWHSNFELETRIFNQSGFLHGSPEQRYAQFFDQVRDHCERSDTPQLVQQQRLNLSLVLYEQWLRYPLFSQEDCLASVHEYRSESIAIKRRTAAIENYLPLVLEKFNLSFWHSMTVAKARYLIWKATEELNSEFDMPRFILPEVIVWKCAEQDRIVASQIGEAGMARLDRKRNEIMVNLFSADRKEAQRHILLMFQKDVVNSLKIRFRYDPHYCAGELATSPSHDVAQIASTYGIEVFKPERMQRLEAAARAERQRVNAMMERYELVDFSPEQVRALRVAYHINEDRIRRRLVAQPAAAIARIRENLGSSRYVERKTSKLHFARGVHLLSQLSPEIYLDIYDQLRAD